jgi:hypothetical protein
MYVKYYTPVVKKNQHPRLKGLPDCPERKFLKEVSLNK